MALSLRSFLKLDVKDGTKIVHSSGDSTTQVATNFTEYSAGSIDVPSGTVEMQVPLGAVEEAKLIFLRSTKNIQIRLVRPGDTALGTTQYNMTANLPGLFPIAAQDLYVSNSGPDDAKLDLMFMGDGTLSVAIASPNLVSASQFNALLDKMDNSSISEDDWLSSVGV